MEKKILNLTAKDVINIQRTDAVELELLKLLKEIKEYAIKFPDSLKMEIVNPPSRLVIIELEKRGFKFVKYEFFSSDFISWEK